MTEKERKGLRIVFWGTPKFAVTSLHRIVEEGYEVCMVVTTPDKPAGRHQSRLTPSAVKEYALEKGLPLMQPANLDDGEFLEALKWTRADVGVVVAFRKLPKVAWAMPRLGTFNLHASLLPNYRGAAPINWAIMNGEKETGVTTFMIDDKIDTGGILLSSTTEIGGNETFGEVSDRLMEMGAELTLRTIKGIETGSLTATPQRVPEPEKLKKAPKLFRENTRIDLGGSPETVHNFVRGLSPVPAAWTMIGEEGKAPQQLKIFRTRPRYEKHELERGTICQMAEDALSIAVDGGYVDALDVQLAGKKRMAAKELLKGHRSILDMHCI